MLPFITEQQSSWEKLQAETRPIYLYGMGDGAVKILNVMREKNISVAGIFASDEFVRGHSFAGFRVKRLADVEAEADDFVIVLAFAAGYPEIVEKITALSQRHTLLVPDVPVTGGGLFTYDYCLQHAAEIEAVYDLLADEASRNVYANILNFKISGEIRFLQEITSEKSDVYRSILRPTMHETYVDLGAYNGDTIQELLQYTYGKYEQIYAVEPDPKNFKKLGKSVQGMPRVKTYQAVAWCKDTEIPFRAKSGRQSGVSSSGKTMEARSVDSILQNGIATLLKMDVEGCEREALWGAAQTIAHFAPKLMISLYHRNEDIFALPLLIRKLNPHYDFYLRHQLYIPAWETNLYAIPRG